MTLTKLEEKRLAKLRYMLEWRMRDDANSHQQAEAESLAWAIDIVEDFFGDENSNL